MKSTPNITESSDLKRTEAFNKLADTHKKHKSIIQAALSNVDSIGKNKIIFDDDSEVTSNKILNGDSTNQSKKRLLESDEESDADIDFRVKKQYEGKGGQQLLQLKTKYHNDSRFKLDERFIDVKDNKDDGYEQQQPNEDVVIEKRQQLKILEEILGKKQLEERNKYGNKRSMIRFDPSLPEHSKFVVQSNRSVEKSKKKRKKESNVENVKVNENQPVVSKEIFYKVDDSLKDVFNEEKSFSLLGTFGQVNGNDNEQNDNTGEYRAEQLKRNNGAIGPNPFRYDSSGDESDTENNKKEHTKAEKTEDSNQDKKMKQVPKMWNEPFFFEKDDHRFQDVQEFMKRIASQEHDNFREQRKDIKSLVKNKIHHNLKKNRMFANKLGGSNKTGKHRKFSLRIGGKNGKKITKSVKK